MGIWENLGMGGYRGFSRPAARLLQQAVQLAGDLGCEQADTSHLLLAMLRQQGAAAQFLTRKNITEPEVRRQLAQRRSAPAQRLDRQSMAPDLRRTMDYALIGAQNAHVSRAEPEHLLCAMLEDDGCAAGLLLAEMGLSLTEAVRECRQLSGQFVLPAQPRVSASIPRGSRASDKDCRDLTRRAAEGELDPVFCREAELDRMVEILCRRQKNDPCLIGEPGVGKTALAEGLSLLAYYGQKNRNRYVAQAQKYIQERCVDSHLSLEMVADSVGITPAYLSRLFYELSEVNFVNYVNECRVQRAKLLLRQSKIPVQEVGFRCGFNSLQNFNRVFKRHTGTTPGAYRKQ